MKMLIKNGLNHKELWSKAVRSQIFEDLSLFLFHRKSRVIQGYVFQKQMNISEQQAPLKGEGGPTVKTLQAHEREFKKVLACYCVLNLKLKCFEIKKTNEQSEAMPSPDGPFGSVYSDEIQSRLHCLPPFYGCTDNTRQ